MAWEYGRIFHSTDDFIKYLEANDKAKHPEIHMHHTANPSHSDWKAKPNARYWQDSMRRYHMDSRGFQDIAQHCTVFPNGSILTGRNPNIPPASAIGYNDSDPDNTHPFMFETYGNFDKGHDKLEGKQLDTVIKLIRRFVNKGSRMVFHRQCLINGKEPKSCPGTGIDYNWLLGLVTAKTSVPAAQMYDLSYFSDYRLIGRESATQSKELYDQIDWAFSANANCVLLLKRGWDLRHLQDMLNKMYPDNVPK